MQMRVDEMLICIKNKIPKTFKITFVSAILVGIICHLYMLTNKLPNYDDVYTINGFGTTFRTGRWFLWCLGAPAYHTNFVFSIPMVNGLFTIFCIACSVGLIAIVLNLKGTISNVLLGSIFVVFPTWVSTMFFMFTAPYYGFALLMYTCSAYLLYKNKKFFLISCLLLSCAIGIYQAYIPYIATFYVIILLKKLFEEVDIKQVLIDGFVYLGNLLTGVGIYFLVMKLSLLILDQTLYDYKGINEIGSISVLNIIQALSSALKGFFFIYINNDLELTPNLLLKIIYFLLYLFVVIFVIKQIYVQIKKRNYLNCIIQVFLYVAYILAINGIFIMCQQGSYSLMYFSYVFVWVLPLVLIDVLFQNEKANNSIMNWLELFFSSVMALSVLCYFQYANGEYMTLDFSYRQTESYYTSMIAQIKATSNFTENTPICFVGSKIDDGTLYRNDVWNQAFTLSGKDETLAEAYSRNTFLKYYCGFEPNYADASEISRDFIDTMPVYPSDGSIQWKDGILVIKLSEE